MALFSQPKPVKADNSSYEAFIDCPNRAMELQKGKSQTFDLTCPKYPKGTSFQVVIHQKDEVEKVAKQLGCKGCPFNNTPIVEQDTSTHIEALHPEIATMVGSLFANEHYPQAVLNGWQTVRAELRARSGHERSSDAFGNGRIDIASDIPEHLRDDVEQGAKFLMMAIDRFRNVGAHSPGGMNALFLDESSSQVTIEFLSVASLAMRLLERNDTGEIQQACNSEQS